MDLHLGLGMAIPGTDMTRSSLIPRILSVLRVIAAGKALLSISGTAATETMTHGCAMGGSDRINAVSLVLAGNPGAQISARFVLFLSPRTARITLSAPGVSAGVWMIGLTLHEP
jgi:hypothetical protein